MKSAPFVLLIWDGFGCGPKGKANAIHAAGMPHFSQLQKQFPAALLEASGTAVGLSYGTVGNSEVGHLTLGAGAVTPSLQQHISAQIAAGRFAQHPAFAQMHNRTVHLVGLVSDGGVHSSLDQLRACIAAARTHGATQIILHALLDGRDTPPGSAIEYLSAIEQEPDVIIASLQGRFYGMDRDNNSDRTMQGSQVLFGEGPHANSWRDALELSYAHGYTDEFVRPVVLTSCHSGLLARRSPTGEDWSGVHAVDPDDLVFFTNTRADRMRQLVAQVRSRHEHCVTLTEYDVSLTERGVTFLYKPQVPATTLLNQLTTQRPAWHIGLVAETEKYAHITYFFDGRREEPRDNVAYALLASHKEESHAQRPAMRAEAITDQICAWANEKSCIIANYANADMVGHSGDREATIEACTVLDQQLKTLYDEIVVKRGGTIMLTSDHGNAEEMMDNHGNPCTSHTKNDVPFLLVRRDLAGLSFAQDRYGLANVAPTMLQLLGCTVPVEMDQAIVISNIVPYSAPTYNPLNQ